MSIAIHKTSLHTTSNIKYFTYVFSSIIARFFSKLIFCKGNKIYSTLQHLTQMQKNSIFFTILYFCKNICSIFANIIFTYHFMVIRKIRCYIIEDDPSAQYILCHYISKFNRLELIGSASTATEAINFLSKDTVDVLFLDLNLPDLHGLKMLEKIKHQPLIVFTTGYPEYAVKSFKHNVIDYLLKPVSEKEFKRAISRVIEKLNLQETVNQLLYPEKHQIIEIEVNAKPEFINSSEIVYAQSYGNYVKIHLQNNLTKLATISTKKLLEKLPGSKFLRIHKSFIINTDFISSQNNNEILLGDQILPVGISYRHHVDQILKNL